MTENGIIGTSLDYGIIVGYFVVVLGFGALFGRYTKTTKDFFFSGQRFPWWLIAFSMVATIVGSYSFIKYSSVAFTYGLSSTQTYWNDWYWMPLFMFGWLPIIYYSRITSIPEYFERRFDRRTRLMATILMLIYLLGYIGINFYTLGVALNAMLGWDLMLAVVVIAVISAIYVTAGGQTSVIMTDLLQGVLLLAAGFLLFGLGLHYLGGADAFWEGLPYRHRLPLAYTNDPPDFNMLGILWQDGLSQGCFVLFLNQGIMMRFLSAKSVREGRKAITFVLLVLQVLAVVAVAGAGWLGRAMASKGLIPHDSDPSTVFVVVSSILCHPGVFGLVMAALTAALMSTADTLINATSAVAVNDLWKVYVKPKATDKQLLRVARLVSLGAAGIGVIMVPVYTSFKSIYAAHAAFTAMVGPPLAVSLLLGAFWKRFTPKAAFWTILVGIGAMALSVAVPDVLAPFALGIKKAGGPGLDGHLRSYFYVRALYGFIVCGLLAVAISLLTRPKERASLIGLVWGTLDEARRRFKGGVPNFKRGRSVVLQGTVLTAAAKPKSEPRSETETETKTETQTETGQQTDAEPFPATAKSGPPLRPTIRLPQKALDALKAQTGDLVYLTDRRWYLGGLRSAHAVIGGTRAPKGKVAIPRAVAEMLGGDPERLLRVEKIM
jgi:SSS family solute:Na+ symporter